MCKICGLNCSFFDDDTPDFSKLSSSPDVPWDFDPIENAEIINRHLDYRERKAYESLYRK